jgi:hypothetical protein
MNKIKQVKEKRIEYKKVHMKHKSVVSNYFQNKNDLRIKKSID